MKNGAEKFVSEVLQEHIPRVNWHIHENELMRPSLHKLNIEKI